MSQATKNRGAPRKRRKGRQRSATPERSSSKPTLTLNDLLNGCIR